MTESKICTCPSGDGSLVHPCPAHPAVEQVGGDERAAFELFVRKHCGMPAHIAVNWDAKFTNDAWEGWQARAALAHDEQEQAAHEIRLLANALGECIQAAGITAPGVPLTGPQLLMFAEDLKRDLQRAALAQPSPAQAEQHWQKLEKPAQVGAIRFRAGLSSRLVVEAAQRLYEFESTPEQEAERPEVVAYRTIGRHEKHQHPHYALNYYKQNAEDQATHWRERGCEVSEDELMTVAQHERIVGALRAKAAQLREALEWRAENQAGQRELLRSVTAERDAALAEVERLRESKGDPVGSLEKCMKVMYERDEHAKRLEVALARVAELELGIARIAGDFLPDNSGQAELALDEMRQTLHELLAAIPTQAQHSVPEEFIGRLSEFLAQRGATGKALLRELRDMLAAAPGKEGV
ncbi:hypothetical protein [Pseudomonas aeruginosa]|uniref:hypothetical protein n=3 Tax=Pseudomonas aeruginosa TaxID=287 RepID=UPI0015C51C8D|nr:hypothetical protein [Pseudomonas aeruginosa]